MAVNGSRCRLAATRRVSGAERVFDRQCALRSEDSRVAATRASSFYPHIGWDLAGVRTATGVDGGDQFVLEKLQNVADAGFAGGSERPDIGPADQHGFGAKSQGFVDIGSAADTAVEQYFGFAIHRFDDLGQLIDA